MKIIYFGAALLVAAIIYLYTRPATLYSPFAHRPILFGEEELYYYVDNCIGFKEMTPFEKDRQVKYVKIRASYEEYVEYDVYNYKGEHCFRYSCTKEQFYKAFTKV